MLVIVQYELTLLLFHDLVLLLRLLSVIICHWIMG